MFSANTNHHHQYEWGVQIVMYGPLC